jgi:hypothetical protein
VYFTPPTRHIFKTTQQAKAKLLELAEDFKNVGYNVKIEDDRFYYNLPNSTEINYVVISFLGTL